MINRKRINMWRSLPLFIFTLFISACSFAMFTFPIGHFSGAVSFMDDVISSIVVEVDATISASYGGSGQTWSNLVASPADGASKTDYDFFLGADGSASNDDPTFTGTAGNNAAFFDLGGDDFFQVAGGNAGTIFEELQKTTGEGPMWICLVYQAVIDQNQALWGNGQGAGESAVRFFMNSTENYRFLQSSSVTLFNQPITANGVVSAEDIIVCLTFDTTNTGSEKIWYNTSTGASWTNSYVPVTNTASPTSAMQIGASSTNFHVPANTRIYAFSAGNSILTDTEAGDIINYLCALHNRNYTGSCL